MQIFLHSTGEKASEVSAGLTIGDFGRIFTERLGNFAIAFFAPVTLRLPVTVRLPLTPTVPENASNV
jgi:hypothetical protein